MKKYQDQPRREGRGHQAASQATQPRAEEYGGKEEKPDIGLDGRPKNSLHTGGRERNPRGQNQSVGVASVLEDGSFRTGVHGWSCGLATMPATEQRQRHDEASANFLSD